MAGPGGGGGLQHEEFGICLGSPGQSLKYFKYRNDNLDEKL